MPKKFNFQKAASGEKTIYNKSHGGFKQANVMNAIAATHKDRCVHKANTYNMYRRVTS